MLTYYIHVRACYGDKIYKNKPIKFKRGEGDVGPPLGRITLVYLFFLLEYGFHITVFPSVGYVVVYMRTPDWGLRQR